MSQMILKTRRFTWPAIRLNGWPLLLLACVSAATKLVIMWLFRWEKTSPAARMKRLASA